MPRVSVVIPTHNRPELVLRAIRSALAQTLRDIEVIVVDDGAAARAESAVMSLHDARVRYFKNEMSRGAPASRNRGAREARAAYVAFLDDDDVWTPSKLERQLAGLEAHPECVGAYTGVRIVDGEGKCIHLRLPREHGPTNIHLRTLARCYIWTSSLMLRTDAVLKEPFDETFRKNQEWDLELRLSHSRPFFAINEPLTVISMLGNGKHMGGKHNLPNIIIGHEQLLAKHADEYVRYPRIHARRLFELATLYDEAGEWRKAKTSFLRAWLLEPSHITHARHALTALSGRSMYHALRALSIRRARLFVKKLPLIGSVATALANRYRASFLARRALRRRDRSEALRILSELYSPAQAARVINEFTRSSVYKTSFSHGHAGDFDAMMLYGLTRLLKPETVVETGVASGRSSSVILAALAANSTGKLYSVDLPHFYRGDQPTYSDKEGNQELQGYVPEGQEPGWLVPQELRNRWELILGDSNVEIPKLISKLSSVDMFYHDSDHSFHTMEFEFMTAWPKVASRGFLLSDDIDWNSAWDQFVARESPSYVTTYRHFGIARRG